MSVASFVLLLLVVVACRSQAESGWEGPPHADVALTELEREGRDQYQQAVERISMPHSGTCWKEAVAALKDGCRHLDEKTHGELALRFSDCFLEMSGLEKHGCQFEDKACLREMNQTAFDTYSKFYIHTQSMCYFLYNQAWHEETEKTISRLTTTSSKMSQQLEESAEAQSKMLSDLLTVSSVIGQVSTVLLAIHNLLLGGCSFFGTVLFFTAAAVALAALGRTRSASSVVPHMFAVLLAGAVTETVIANWFTDDAATQYQLVWLLRCLETVLCTVLLGYAAWRYQRYGPANNTLLKIIDNKVERVLLAVLKLKMARAPSQSSCVKCEHNNGTQSDNTYYNLSKKEEKSLPGIYEDNKREGVFSQSARGSFLLRRSPVRLQTSFPGPLGSHYSSTGFGTSERTRQETPGLSRRSTTPFVDARLTRRSPTPFADARLTPAPPSPPPPYDSVDSNSETTETTAAPLTRRDFYTPEREMRSVMDMKKAVVRIEPLNTTGTPSVAETSTPQPPRLQTPTPRPSRQQTPTPQPPRRRTPTRKVRQSRSDAELRGPQSGAEYSLRSHSRDAGSLA